jgi:protein-disulfide isomerase
VNSCFKSMLGVLTLAALAGCSPPASSLKKTIEDNPDILFGAIEKHPDKFFEVVEKAGQAAREKAQSGQFEKELDRIKEELKKPVEVKVDDNRIIGNKAAAVTVIEYSDYNCGHCSTAHKTVMALKEKYGDKVRFVFKHLPILAPTSRVAAEYTEAIRFQDPAKAYEFHHEIFENQGDLRQGGEEFLKKTMKKIGVDVAKAAKDKSSSKVKEVLEGDVAEARKNDFNGTPGFLVNGAAVRGAYPQAFFEQVIDYILSQSAK